MGHCAGDPEPSGHYLAPASKKGVPLEPRETVASFLQQLEFPFGKSAISSPPFIMKTKLNSEK